jgi:4-carboxymuconolactone decarboxylase
MLRRAHKRGGVNIRPWFSSKTEVIAPPNLRTPGHNVRLSDPVVSYAVHVHRGSWGIPISISRVRVLNRDTAVVEEPESDHVCLTSNPCSIVGTGKLTHTFITRNIAPTSILYPVLGTMENLHKLDEAHAALWENGIKIRKEVAGEDYVNKSLATGSSDFAKPMQDLATEVGWGWVWAREGLDRKTRSLLNVAMLCALNRSTELAVHVRGAVNNGASDIEIRETIVQAAIYSGFPAGLEGTRVAERVLNTIKEEEAQEHQQQQSGQP